MPQSPRKKTKGFINAQVMMFFIQDLASRHGDCYQDENNRDHKHHSHQGRRSQDNGIRAGPGVLVLFSLIARASFSLPVSSSHQGVDSGQQLPQ